MKTFSRTEQTGLSVLVIDELGERPFIYSDQNLSYRVNSILIGILFSSATVRHSLHSCLKLNELCFNTLTFSDFSH